MSLETDDEPAAAPETVETVERTDIGSSMEARLKRGSGTRDEDSVTIKAKGKTAEEAIDEFYKLLTATKQKPVVGFGIFSPRKTTNRTHFSLLARAKSARSSRRLVSRLTLRVSMSVNVLTIGPKHTIFRRRNRRHAFTAVALADM